MLGSQTVVLKTSRSLLTFMHLAMLSDPKQVHKIFKNTFSLTKRLSSPRCWFHLQHFTFLLGCWEPSLHCTARGVWKQPQFSPTALNSFSEGWDYWFLLCLSHGLHQFAPEGFKTKGAFCSMGKQAAGISLCRSPLWELAEEELTTVLFSAFAGWSHWHPIWPRLSRALPSVLWGRHYNIQEF